MKSAVASPVETVLRDELARADRALGGVAPVLEHVLAGAERSLVSDAIVARVRGMLNDLAQQFTLRLQSHESDETAPDRDRDRNRVGDLARQLASDAPILIHIHAAAVEGVLTERLDQRSAIDPVLSPLWQELIASQDAAVGETGMQALAAQSRFMQQQRRMQHSALDLPADILERALRIWVRAIPVEEEPPVTQAMRTLKADYDEAQTRLGLIARLIASMRSGVVAALELEHAGFALFVSALAQRTGQSRERAVMACHDRQAARLVVSLRAAGLDIASVERQFVCLEPSESLPRDLEDLSADTARAMLDDSASQLALDGQR